MEVRHNGAFVMRGTENEVEVWKKAHSDMEGVEVVEGGPFELHVDEKEHGSFVTSFATLEDARAAYDQVTSAGDGEAPRPAQFPKAEVRSAVDGAVVHPLSAPASTNPETPSDPLVELPVAELPTDPAPPES